MKLIHMDAPPQRKTVRAAVAALSAFFLCSCAAPVMNPAYPSQMPYPIAAEKPPESEPAMEANAIEKKDSALLSSWTRGRCIFKNGHISYSDDLASRRSSLRPDSGTAGARTLLCSDDFTVLLLPQRVIVSLGGESILSGREMLGMVGGRYIAANSYEVSLGHIISEDGGVSSALLDGAVLRIISSRGRSWSIHLGDPFNGWSIYCF
ncbi:MAG: hypothetical protein V1861_05045 [Candidatus Micrarchaeota archaeon]